MARSPQRQTPTGTPSSRRHAGADGTWRLLHENDLGVLQEVMAGQDHPLPADDRAAGCALLLHEGQLLCRPLGCEGPEVGSERATGATSPPSCLSVAPLVTKCATQHCRKQQSTATHLTRCWARPHCPEKQDGRFLPEAHSGDSHTLRLLTWSPERASDSQTHRGATPGKVRGLRPHRLRQVTCETT